MRQYADLLMVSIQHYTFCRLELCAVCGFANNEYAAVCGLAKTEYAVVCATNIDTYSSPSSLRYMHKEDELALQMNGNR